ncbi:phosphoglycolate phosphatase [Candidatus Magnetaquicoccus inordinatus]|uniref:phosphoglycolate phosphatase n=1 Tax=Candidatus Magnetaquicoccus inordinatus TaxID=2496818 RepID=UPI00187D26E8|nr:phosphoglycolate phosphatase [Candidatus Magnetaquicoccus inordinatus]
MIAPLSVQALLFDLDGTLVDSAPDLCAAMNHVLQQRGFPLLDLQQVRHLVGDGARTLLARGFWGEEAKPPLQDPSFEEAVTLFLDYYRLHLTDHSRPYPGTSSMLQHFQQQGVPMAVVTNKPEALALAMLEQLQLRSFFSYVVGGDSLPQRKPAPEPLLFPLAQWHIPAQEAVMIGDSQTDLQAARAAGCPMIWMGHGYNRGISPESLHPDRLLEHFAQLPLCVHIVHH